LIDVLSSSATKPRHSFHATFLARYEQTVRSVNVIARMAPVTPWRLARRASFLYKTNLELGSEHASFYQLELNARGLAQLIAGGSWEVVTINGM